MVHSLGGFEPFPLFKEELNPLLLWWGQVGENVISASGLRQMGQSNLLQEGLDTIA